MLPAASKTTLPAGLPPSPVACVKVWMVSKVKPPLAFGVNSKTVPSADPPTGVPPVSVVPKRFPFASRVRPPNGKAPSAVDKGMQYCLRTRAPRTGCKSYRYRRHRENLADGGPTLAVVHFVIAPLRLN